MQRPGGQSDEGLMARFQQGLDAAAFDEIVSRFMRPGLAVARQILSDAALAEDAVQEAFLRVVGHREKYSPGRSFSSWFYTIVRNVCVDMVRRRARQRSLVEEMARRRPAQQAPADPDAAEALELLDALPKGERDVVELRVVGGLSFAEVAAATGISVEAAKKRAQRGLRRLQAKCRRDAVHRANWGRRGCPPGGLPDVQEAGEDAE